MEWLMQVQNFGSKIAKNDSGGYWIQKYQLAEHEGAKVYQRECWPGFIAFVAAACREEMQKNIPQ